MDEFGLVFSNLDALSTALSMPNYYSYFFKTFFIDENPLTNSAHNHFPPGLKR